MDVDEIHFDINKIKKKLKELASLHDKHLNRPTLDDNFDEEKSIDFLTQEITNVRRNVTFFTMLNYFKIFLFSLKKKILSQSQNKVRKISIKSNMSSLRVSATDQRLMKNVVNSLASSLQDLLNDFRKNQNTYLKSNFTILKK